MGPVVFHEADPFDLYVIDGPAPFLHHHTVVHRGFDVFSDYLGFDHSLPVGDHLLSQVHHLFIPVTLLNLVHIGISQELSKDQGKLLPLRGSEVRPILSQSSFGHLREVEEFLNNGPYLFSADGFLRTIPIRRIVQDTDDLINRALHRFKRSLGTGDLQARYPDEEENQK